MAALPVIATVAAYELTFDLLPEDEERLASYRSTSPAPIAL